MSITFRGSIAPFKEQPGTNWGVNQFDLDVLKATLACRPVDAPFLLGVQLVRGALLTPGFLPSLGQGPASMLMYLRSWTPRYTRSFVFVDIEYVGVADLRARYSQYSANTKENTVTLHEAKGNTQCVLTYKGQTMTVRYYSLQRPQGPIFANCLLKSQEDFQILSRTGNMVNLLNVGTHFGLANSNQFYAVEQVFGNLSIEQVGIYWLATETNEGRLIDGALPPAATDPITGRPILQAPPKETFIKFLNP